MFHVRDYDLASTLNSGQVFRWEPATIFGDLPAQSLGKTKIDVPRCSWVGVIDSHWLRLTSIGADAGPNGQTTIIAELAETVSDWSWLSHYLQLHVNLEDVLATFPQDEPMRAAVAACRGLRLLRQDPWECLASFILSSTKQIVQIRQIVDRVCACFGEPLNTLPGERQTFSFPSAARLAQVAESALRACKMGFRAPYLLAAARKVDSGALDLQALRQLSVEQARAQLMEFPGVGRKIADCVLLFAYGFQSAFPVDVWVMKALRELYFRRRRTNLKRLQQFAETHFGPNAGYAQQYLFHYMRMRNRSRS